METWYSGAGAKKDALSGEGAHSELYHATPLNMPWSDSNPGGCLSVSGLKVTTGGDETTNDPIAV
ncbi:MAG: hypothetical protein AB1805_16445, partial [Nitrospirota bacterium]